ncbi:hypothetical protein JW962_00820 [Candidatus Dojkabacteria bacterium]|nr:hypothetical protein [Candidatus Dojkabacteria bacterium]
MSTNAFVTFLMLNDSYLPGSLVLGYALRKQNIKADLVCLVTPVITQEARAALSVIYDHVIEVNEIYVPHKDRQRRQDVPYLCTRFNALRLGADGDLGVAYEKIVILDSDVLPLKNYMSLSKLNTPAGILNEKKGHFKGTNDNRENLTEWSWHEVYGDICPHGARVPQEITDRVKYDPSNMGMNGSLFVVTPSYVEFKNILKDINSPLMAEYVGDKFVWPDMQYLTMRWSGSWYSVDIKYSGLNGYPNLNALNGTHFAGVKPWYFKRDKKAVISFSKFPDYQLWYKTYLEMIKDYPQLLNVKRLNALVEYINGIVVSF